MYLKRLSLAKIAALIVAVQMALSAIAILIYLTFRADLSLPPVLDAGPLKDIFERSFPIASDNFAAQRMFQRLFVPLAYMHLFSLGVLGVMLLIEIGDIVWEPRKYSALILMIILYVAGSGVILFAPTDLTVTPPLRLKRLILNGDSFGYFTIFVGGAFLNIAMLLNLPSEKRRARSYVG